jgi:hypothetical protein
MAEHIPIVIIGAGPLALHLGKQGVKSVFISRHSGPLGPLLNH